MANGTMLLGGGTGTLPHGGTPSAGTVLNTIGTAPVIEPGNEDAFTKDEFDLALRRASGRIDEMASKARADRKAGKTKKFPV